MRVALFGGAFDPPHIGHQRVAQEMIGRDIVDEVWYVPVYEHPWADRLGKWQLAAYEHRQKMVGMILTPHTRLMEYKKISFTYPTLVEFAARYPEHQFSWIIGADNLAAFGDWDYYQQIISEFGVYVYPRQGFKLKTELKDMKLLKNFPEVVVSSTVVREKIKAEADVSGLVTEEVLSYIENNNLYANC